MPDRIRGECPNLSIVREDVAYIKAKIDTLGDHELRLRALEQTEIDALPDHETRIRSLEHWKWGLPITAVATILAFLGFNLPNQLGG